MDLTKLFGLVRVVILSQLSFSTSDTTFFSDVYISLSPVMVSFFSALVLIMGALVTNFTTTSLRGYFVYAAFAIAIAVLTLLTVPVMCVLFFGTHVANNSQLCRIFLSINRKGAFPSMIIVELSYFGKYFPCSFHTHSAS